MFLKSITHKLLFFSALLFVLSSGVIGVVTYRMLSGYLVDDIAARLSQTAMDINARLSDSVEKKKRFLSIYTKNINLTIAIKRKRHAIINSLFEEWKEQSDFSQFLILHEDGTVLMAQRPELHAQNVADAEWFQEAKRYGVSDIKSVCIDHSMPVFWLLEPFSVQDENYSLAAQIHLPVVSDFLDKVNIDGKHQDEKNYIILTNREGDILYLPPFMQEREKKLIRKNLFETGNYQILQTIFHNKQHKAILDTDLYGARHFVAFSLSEDLPLTVIISKERGKTLAILNDIQKSSIFFSVLIFGLCLIVLVLIILKIIKPIQELSQTASQISQGNYPELIQISADTELNKLIDTFNYMIIGIKKREQRLEDLYEGEKSISLQLENSNDMLKEQTDKLHKKNVQLQVTLSKLHKAQEDLIRAEKMAVVGETSAMVAHEILNPVSSILTRVEIGLAQWDDFKRNTSYAKSVLDNLQEKCRDSGLQNAPDTEKDPKNGGEDFTLLQNFLSALDTFQREREDNLNFLRKQLNRIVKIIHTLREATTSKRSVHRMFLTSIIDDVFDLLMDSLQKRKISFHTDIQPDLPPLNVDETEMIQVFSNLVRNAMQSIDAKKEKEGTITISAAEAGNNIEIRVEDNGAGVSDLIRKSIFDFQFTTKDLDLGTSLGLSISRRFIQGYGGNLTLEKSIEGEGSVFLVRIPVAGNNNG